MMNTAYRQEERSNVLTGPDEVETLLETNMIHLGVWATGVFEHWFR
jgi:hypothetical protein